MNRVLKTGVLSFVIAVMLASVAAASGTITVKVALKGTAASAPGANTGADGQCTGTGDAWLDGYVCSGPGNCECHEVTATISGTGLKGATVTNFFVMGDKGMNPATAPTVDSGPSGQCKLFLGALTVTNQSNSTTFNLLGASCKHVKGITKNNPSGTNDENLMSGGWGVSDTPSPTVATSGWGTYTGIVNTTTEAVSFSLSGWMTQ